MAARQDAREGGTQLVWERPEPAERRIPVPLSRDRIVQTALSIADTDGLGAVSLRNVAAALEAGPMRLYGYLATKNELLDLMVDAVYGEFASDAPIPGTWRDVVRALAGRTRRAAQRHPWFVDLLGGRPHRGPHALAHLEAALAAVSAAPGFGDIDAALQAVKTVNAYVIGALQSEAVERRADSESGTTLDERRTADWPYLQRMIATGRFPTIGRVVCDAVHPAADVAFDQGLELVLDGITARYAPPTGATRRGRLQPPV